MDYDKVDFPIAVKTRKGRRIGGPSEIKDSTNETKVDTSL